jgi:hypothetical protein
MSAKLTAIGKAKPEGSLPGIDLESPPPVRCPFTVIVDSREQEPYTFASIKADADQGSALMEVPVMRTGLPVGDYSVFGLPSIAIERKSKADLYGSISQRRENFEQRLKRMAEERLFAAIVVESEYADIINSPPPHTMFAPKSLSRTIFAWMQRYRGVHWIFCRDRQWAEATTFRLLERWWKDHKDQSFEFAFKENPEFYCLTCGRERVAYRPGDPEEDGPVTCRLPCPCGGPTKPAGVVLPACPKCVKSEAVAWTLSGWLCGVCAVNW